MLSRSATLSYSLKDVPEKEEVIELFAKNCMMCLASGAVNHLFKFYFFAEMVRLYSVSKLFAFVRVR